MKTLSYAQRIHILNLPTLELRRLHSDLVYCYKIIFGVIDVSRDDFFAMCSSSVTRRHRYKLYKPSCAKSVRSLFFTSRVIKFLFYSLPIDTDFSSLNSFMRAVQSADFSQFLIYEK